MASCVHGDFRPCIALYQKNDYKHCSNLQTEHSRDCFSSAQEYLRFWPCFYSINIDIYVKLFIKRNMTTDYDLKGMILVKNTGCLDALLQEAAKD